MTETVAEQATTPPRMTAQDHYDSAMELVIKVATEAMHTENQANTLQAAAVHAQLGELAFKLGHKDPIERTVGFQ
jgi:hypothetical protein